MSVRLLRLLAEAKAAADRVHTDTSVSEKETLASLKDLRNHIDTLVEAVECSTHGAEDE